MKLLRRTQMPASNPRATRRDDASRGSQFAREWPRRIYRVPRPNRPTPSARKGLCPGRFRRISAVLGAILFAEASLTACSATPEPTASTDIPPAETAAVLPSPAGSSSIAPPGWVAYFTNGPEEDIYFVKPGFEPRLALESDGASRGQVCPAFSPDGKRLASGEGGYGQQLPKDGALVISALTPDGEVAASEVISLDGLRQQPCPIWSPDGRWVAFGVGGGVQVHGWNYPAAGAVWLYDTDTGDVRRVSGLSATDIEWAADSAQLYIATAHGIAVYSIPEDQIRVLDDTQGAVALTASPDGGSLAVERRHGSSNIIPLEYDLWLMSVGGGDRRLLVEDYAHDRGIGPVWSPDGKRIVLQGGAESPLVLHGGETYADGQNDKVLIVTVAENDPLGPVGTQTMLAPLEAIDGDGARRWYPIVASWSPDSAFLRVVGLELLADGVADDTSGALLAVPIDGSAPTLLVTGPGPIPPTSPPQNDFQSWSRQ